MVIRACVVDEALALKLSPFSHVGSENGDLGEIMKIKVLIAVVLSLAMVLVGVAVFLDWRAGIDTAKIGAAAEESSMPRQSGGTGNQTSSTSDPEATATGAAPDSEVHGLQIPQSWGTTASRDEVKKPTPEATRPSWDPKPNESDTGLEVPTQTATDGFALPSTEERKPVLGKVPATGVAKGKLTKGFPKDAVPLPKSTTIVQSSVEEQGDLVVIGVEGRSKASVEEVLDFYDIHFKSLNWLSSESTPGEGLTRIQGSYAGDSATVTVSELPTGMISISVAGVFKVVD